MILISPLDLTMFNQMKKMQLLPSRYIFLKSCVIHACSTSEDSFLLKLIVDIVFYFIAIMFYFRALVSKCSDFKICHKSDIIVYRSVLILPNLKTQHFLYDFTKWYLTIFKKCVLKNGSFQLLKYFGSLSPLIFSATSTGRRYFHF